MCYGCTYLYNCEDNLHGKYYGFARDFVNNLSIIPFSADLINVPEIYSRQLEHHVRRNPRG